MTVWKGSIWASGADGSGEVDVYSITDPAIDAAVTAAIVDVYGGVIITTTAAGNAQTIADPTNVLATKEFIVVNNDTSTDSITVNSVVIDPGEAQKYFWDLTAWITLETMPTHASTHTNGTDDIQSATNTQKGLATAAHIAAIEANTAAKHTQNTDTGTTSDTFQIDSGNSGPQWKNDSGTMSARNAADAADAPVSVRNLTLTEYALGNISGAVTIDSDDGAIQSGTLSDDITGWTFSSISGQPVFLHLDNAEETHAITSADDTENEFEVAGDVTHKLEVGSAFSVSGSTGNDDDYEVTGVTYDSGNDKTVIEVASVADGTDDGDITIGGYGITLDTDYTIGTLPTSGIFTMYVYQQGTDVYAVIADAFEAVV
jgi:hypothetical protein